MSDDISQRHDIEKLHMHGTPETLDYSFALSVATFRETAFINQSYRGLPKLPRIFSSGVSSSPLDSGTQWNLLNTWCKAEMQGDSEVAHLYTSEWSSRDILEQQGFLIGGPVPLTHFLVVKRKPRLWKGGGETFSVVLSGKIEEDHQATRNVYMASRIHWDSDIDGLHVFGFTVIDPGQYTVKLVLQHKHYSGYLGPHANDTGIPEESCPPGNINVEIPTKHLSFKIQRTFKSPKGLYSFSDRGLAPVCGKLSSQSGRWIDNEWVPWSCNYRRANKELLEECAKESGLALIFVGDSIMRGIYFDVADILFEKEHDRERGKWQEMWSLNNSRIYIQFVWLDTKTTTDIPSLTHLPLHPNVNAYTAIIMNANLHDTKNRNSSSYIKTIESILDSTNRLPLQSRALVKLIWRSGAASHPTKQRCGDCQDYRYMSPDRVEWFGTLGMGVVENWNAAQAESKGGGKTVDVMDMLSMTLSREDLAGREHWDKLYISHGIVSLEATNVLLNRIC